VSAVYGVVNFHGAPVELGSVRAMEAALRYFGPDGGGEWLGQGVALGQRVLATTPEARFDEEPWRFPGLAVAAAGRLDNREELACELGVAAADLPSIGDGALIAQAWRRWGEGAPNRLFGDWAFAAWDSAERRLFLARDHFGNTALYYHFDGRRFVFGSSRKALFAWPHVPRRLNELRLAQHLTLWITDGAATLHEGIFRLPPAHMLTLSEKGLRVSRYWKAENLPDLRLATDQDYVEQFLDLYDKAVRARIRGTGPIATTLSAGLDSGSVTALAARAAHERNRRLIAFTARPSYPPREGARSPFLLDEWPLAHRVAQHSGVDDHRQVLGEGITPLQAMRRSLEVHDEPEYAAANLDWIQDLLGNARDSGARVLLTGQVGNAGVSWTGDRHRIVRLLLRGRIGRAMLELAAWRAQNNLSVARALWREIVSPLKALAAAKAFKPVQGGPNMPGRGIINPQFRTRSRILERMRESGYDPFFSAIAPPLQQRLGILLPDINPIGALWHENGAAYGLDICDPTADLRLLEFCLRIPDEQFRRDGHDRLLMRRAMRGLIPPEVIWNRRPGRQGSDFADRLRADAHEMDAALASISASAASEYLDLPSLHARWARIRHHPDGVTLHEASAFGRAVQFGLFLAENV
jgi:asparagine synthase (glutamine-hydrolysing)